MHIDHETGTNVNKAITKMIMFTVPVMLPGDIIQNVPFLNRDSRLLLAGLQFRRQI